MSSPANPRPRRSLADVWLFIQAFFWLAGMQAAIAFFRFQTLARWLGLEPGQTANFPAPEQSTVTQKVAWAVAAGARRTPWVSTCLAQALAGAALLKARKIPGQVTLGVAKDPASKGGYAAHAWLTSGGNILTGAAGHERYQVIAVFKL